MKKTIPLFFLLGLLVIACDEANLRNPNITADKTNKEFFLNEKGDTVILYYRDDGTIRSKVTIKNRYKNGPAFNYYDNGSIQHEIHYRNGYKHGLAKYYYETGELYRETSYVDGYIEGIRRLYYKSGALKAEIPYKKGILQEGTKEYSSSGTLRNDYPDLIIKKVIAQDQKNFYLQFSLDPEKSKVRYFLEITFNNGRGIIELDKYTRDGIVTYPFRPPPELMEKMEIKAEINTRRGNPMILSKKINLASLKN
jgi:hypothetical protein